MDLICVDMDNTILDSDKPHILAYNMTFRKNKLRQVSAKRLKKFFGLVSYEIIKKLFPKLKNKEIIKLVNDNNMFFMNQSDPEQKQILFIVGQTYIEENLKSNDITYAEDVINIGGVNATRIIYAELSKHGFDHYERFIYILLPLKSGSTLSIIGSCSTKSLVQCSTKIDGIMNATVIPSFKFN